MLIEATGSPRAGIAHALAAIAGGKQIIVVTVEAAVFAGPVLAAKAGVVYSMAYGDLPALVLEMVAWARAAGSRVAAAGKDTKYLPDYLNVTPDTTGWFAAMSKPFHMIGLGLSISVLSAALQSEASGCARQMRGTVTSVAKKPPD